MRVPRRRVATWHAGATRLHLGRGADSARAQYRGDLVPTRQPPGRAVALPGEPAAADDPAEPARVSTRPFGDPRQPAVGPERAGGPRPVSFTSARVASSTRRRGLAAIRPFR